MYGDLLLPYAVLLFRDKPYIYTKSVVYHVKTSLVSEPFKAKFQNIKTSNRIGFLFSNGGEYLLPKRRFYGPGLMVGAYACAFKTLCADAY
jgi:hypothetical protein